MADNSSIPVASGNETFANKDIGGVKYPRHIQVDGTGAEVVSATSAKQDTANTALSNILAKLTTDQNGEYETVAASQTDQVLGATGAIGDYLAQLTIQPTSTTVGNVIVKDGATTIYTYPGGTVTAALYPFTVSFNIAAVSAGFKVTTGAGVTVLASGNFT